MALSAPHVGPVHDGVAASRSRARRDRGIRLAPVLSLVAIVLVVLALVVLAAPPARAHAALVVSDPRDGAVLAEPPDRATLTFNESVATTGGAVRVFDRTGARVDDGVQTRPDPESVAVGLGDLADDGYVVTYLVTSADGHVIRGALTFRIGDAAPVGDETVAAVFGGRDLAVTATTVVRALDVGAALIAVGAAASLLGVTRTRRHRALARQTARIAAVVGMEAAVATLPLQVLATSGSSGLGSAEAWSDTLTSSVGVSALTRIAGLVVLLALLESRAESRAGPPARRSGWGAWAGAAALTLGSFLLDGHTRTVEPRVVMVVGDAVHLLAGALWAGGLVVLARILHGVGTEQDVGDPESHASAQDPDRDVLEATTAGRVAGTAGPVARAATAIDAGQVGGSPPGAAPGEVPGDDRGTSRHRHGTRTGHGADSGAAGEPVAVARALATWSGWALWSMLAVVVAGSAMSWVLVRQPRALTSTDQGWTLVAKFGVVVVILVIAAWNRWRLVPAVTSGGADAAEATRLLRASVRLEVAGLVLVVAITAILVGLRPAAAEAGISGAFDTVVAVGDDADLNLVVDPNRAGPNDIHLYVLDTTGRPLDDATDVRLELLQVDQDIGPLLRTPLPAGPGHWVLSSGDLAVAGEWAITAIVGRDQFTQERVTIDVVVNDP